MEGNNCCSTESTGGAKKMCAGTWIAAVLLIVGGLNWGLVGAFEFNLVTYLFGQWPVVERVVYGLVGLSAIFAIIKCAMMCKSCCKSEEKTV